MRARALGFSRVTYTQSFLPGHEVFRDKFCPGNRFLAVFFNKNVQYLMKKLTKSGPFGMLILFDGYSICCLTFLPNEDVHGDVPLLGYIFEKKFWKSQINFTLKIPEWLTSSGRM